MNTMADDVMFDNTVIIPLHEVIVDNGCYQQAYHVFAGTEFKSVSELLSIGAIEECNIISVKRYYGLCDEFTEPYKKGYRIAGIEKDTDRIVVRRSGKDGDYEEFRINVAMDSNWIMTTWQRIENMVN